MNRQNGQRTLNINVWVKKYKNRTKIHFGALLFLYSSFPSFAAVFTLMNQERIK